MRGILTGQCDSTQQVQQTGLDARRQPFAAGRHRQNPAHHAIEDGLAGRRIQALGRMAIYDLGAQSKVGHSRDQDIRALSSICVVRKRRGMGGLANRARGATAAFAALARRRRRMPASPTTLTKTRIPRAFHHHAMDGVVCDQRGPAKRRRASGWVRVGRCSVTRGSATPSTKASNNDGKFKDQQTALDARRKPFEGRRWDAPCLGWGIRGARGRWSGAGEFCVDDRKCLSRTAWPFELHRQRRAGLVRRRRRARSRPNRGGLGETGAIGRGRPGYVGGFLSQLGRLSYKRCRAGRVRRRQ
ncbi:hypothetical protein DFP72DRAFT_354071 [Ephemerocybe angulata]|uniref:Uncharacterized protein n=1 Tax=Ephemerocybe angulata TaxID=980116 RepID=A0A8H6HXC8_9AGAR|nr:hypothetical protein DFP72DRAFT_354071 [Tulosesus angulatus]